MSSKARNVKKLTEEQERLNELFTSEYLGLGDTSKLKLDNPLDFRSSSDDPLTFLLKRLRQPENFWLAAKLLLNINLHPFQLVILKELWHRKYPMLIASRGASKSFMLAIYCLLRGLFEQGCKIVIVGAAFRQAKVIFEYCEAIWQKAPVLRSIVGVKGANTKHKNGPARDIDRCTFRLGDSIIIALPLGDGEKIRGQRAQYIIADEFASIPKEIYDKVVSGFASVSASPIEKVQNAARIRVLKRKGLWSKELEEEEKDYNRGNQAIIAGTADYGFKHFAEYWNQYKAIITSKGDPHKIAEIFKGEIPAKFNHNHYSIIRFSVKLLPEGFMDEEHVARAKATTHSHVYNMEYGACFVADSNGFFKRSLIESCTTKDPIECKRGPVKFHSLLKGNPKRKYVFGVDPASERDNFSIDILEINEDHRRNVFCWTTTRKSHKDRVKHGLASEQDFYGFCARKIRNLMKDFPCIGIAMDSQGGGIAVYEALNDPDKMLPGEQKILPIIDDDDPQETDDQKGLHILELVQFADAKYTSSANHSLRKDLEDKMVLFPYLDPRVLGLAIEEDKIKNRRFDTLEDVMMEIEELKAELTTIVHTQTGQGNRDRWDTPEIKEPGGRKGRLRKDRYSALLMANALARKLVAEEAPVQYKAYGGFTNSINKNRIKGEHKGDLYDGPAWFTENAPPAHLYGRAIVKR
jgi:hypothetical protein